MSDNLVRDIRICLWPDNDWCDKEDSIYFGSKSDDYIEVNVSFIEYEIGSFDYDQMIKEGRHKC